MRDLITGFLKIQVNYVNTMSFILCFCYIFHTIYSSNCVVTYVTAKRGFCFFCSFLYIFSVFRLYHLRKSYFMCMSKTEIFMLLSCIHCQLLDVNHSHPYNMINIQVSFLHKTSNAALKFSKCLRCIFLRKLTCTNAYYVKTCLT